MTEHDLPQQQKNLWLKGLNAIQLKNYDYAVSLILNVVKSTPEFLEGRKMLRRAESEKIRGQKKSAFSLGGGLTFQLKSNAKKDPWEGIQELEDSVFQKDPYSQTANESLYDFAMRMAQPDLAAFALETIREGHPGNTKNLHRLAEHYMAYDQPDKAGEVYRQIIKTDARDMDAIKGEKDAAAKSSIINQGWNKEGGFRNQLKNKDQANKDENRVRQGMTREQMQTTLDQYFEEYAEDQNNLNVVKRIAELCEMMDDPQRALEYYSWAVQLSPADVALQNRAEMVRNHIDDAEIKRMEAEIEADPHAPDLEEKRARIREIKRHRLSGLITEARNKVERNPTDKQYRFDLANVLFLAEEYRTAIPELQQAKSNPHIRNKAILMLGKCFARLNMSDLAIGAFNEAVREITVFNNEKKELLYELGLVYERVGKQDDYLNCMKEIYNNDYGYLDVAKRVESSYGQ